MKYRSVVAMLALATVGFHSAADEEITPAHVYQAVEQVSANVDLIREVMGRPETTTEPWVVIDAQPRHVFY